MLLRVSLWSAVLATLGLVAGAAPASAAGAVRYVALGDSYTSGLGAGGMIISSGSCDRSTKAFSRLWANANHPARYVSVACSGATTGTVISRQLFALTAATTLVSITVGGNDVGFKPTMETCVLHSTRTCVAAVRADEAQIRSALPGKLNKLLGDITRAAPHARVIVLGYPDLYDLSRSSTCIGLSTTDRTDLNQAADELDAAIRAAAGAHGDAFVDVRRAFAGHDICDSRPWLHSVNFLDISESYHPNAAGQADGYLPAFTAAVAG
jgi:lysophospholipase L1-like esterase